jgi:hypothetical protein
LPPIALNGPVIRYWTAPGGGKVYPGRGGNLWKVSRQGAGWDEAMRLPATVNSMTATFSPSIAADGSLYFM